MKKKEQEKSAFSTEREEEKNGGKLFEPDNFATERSGCFINILCYY